MSTTIKLDEALERIKNSNGHFFGVSFIKRGTGEPRKMLCRLGVVKYLRGGDKPFNDEDHALVTVYDIQVKGYRSIPVEAITGLSTKGRWVRVTR